MLMFVKSITTHKELWVLSGRCNGCAVDQNSNSRIAHIDLH